MRPDQTVSQLRVLVTGVYECRFRTDSQYLPRFDTGFLAESARLQITETRRVARAYSSMSRLPRVRSYPKWLFMSILRKPIVVTLVLISLAMGWLAPPSPAAAELTIPESPAGDQLTWALDQIATAATGTTRADIESHFSDAYLDVITPDELIWYFSQYLAPVGPFEIVRWEGGATELRNNAVMLGPAGYWRVELTVTADSSHKIDLMWFEPVAVTTTPDAAPTSWSDLKRSFSAIAPLVSVTIGEVHDGSCDPIARVEPDLVLPIASSFKLYVLGELAYQVGEGTAAWDELLPLQTRYISQPNGDMRYMPVGSEYPLSYYADQMISKSDNTATDHLIARLGRTQVESAFALMGQSDPLVNVPLMFTREWFALRMRFSDDELQAYLASNDDERLAFLQDVADPVADSIVETEPWPGSAWASQIEWFASSGDLCRALAYLQHHGEQPGMQPVLNALSLKPEIVFDPTVWSYVGYKGGYETGVMSEKFPVATDRWALVCGLGRHHGPELRNRWRRPAQPDRHRGAEPGLSEMSRGSW